MNYLKVLAIAFALFVVLRSTTAFFTMVVGQKKIRLLFRRIFPVIEMFLWFLWFFWATNLLFQHKIGFSILISSLIVVLVVITGWYLLRDFVAGIILKAENGFEPGQTINTELGSGTIKRLGYRSLELIGQDGTYLKIPFSKLSAVNISRPADKGKWIEHSSHLKIAKKYSLEEIQKKIEQRLLEMPWIVVGEHIKIKIVADENDHYLVEVRYQTINSELAIKSNEKLQQFVTEVFS